MEEEKLLPTYDLILKVKNKIRDRVHFRDRCFYVSSQDNSGRTIGDMLSNILPKGFEAFRLEDEVASIISEFAGFEIRYVIEPIGNIDDDALYADKVFGFMDGLKGFPSFYGSKRLMGFSKAVFERSRNSIRRSIVWWV